LHFADIRLEVLDCTAAKEVWHSSIKSRPGNAKNESGKPRRGRPPKIKTNLQVPAIEEPPKCSSEGVPSETMSILSNESSCAENKEIKRGRGRPKKLSKCEGVVAKGDDVVDAAKRARGRPRKNSSVDGTGDVYEYDYVLTATGNYSCLRCPKVFSSKCSYILHCEDCLDKSPKLTVNCDSDLRHSKERQGHGQPALSPKKLEINSTSMGGPAVCPLCSKFFMKLAKMLQHLVRVHYYETLNLPNLTGSRLCSLCDATIPAFEKGSGSMQDHMFNEHVDWLSCPVCKNAFATKTTMLQHLHNNHSVPKALEILKGT
jgi:hypothetical protein